MQVSKVRLRSLQRKEIQSKQRDHQRPDKRLSCIKRADQLLMLYQTGCQLDQFRLPCRRPKYRPPGVEESSRKPYGVQPEVTGVFS